MSTTLKPGTPEDFRCPQCGAVNTHWLTCPTLQLPAGYRFEDDDREATP